VQCAAQVGELPVAALGVVLDLITSGEPCVYPALNLLHFASFHPRLLAALLQLDVVQVGPAVVERERREVAQLRALPWLNCWHFQPGSVGFDHTGAAGRGQGQRGVRALPRRHVAAGACPALCAPSTTLRAVCCAVATSPRHRRSTAE
jgi:hypothetical protein